MSLQPVSDAPRTDWTTADPGWGCSGKRSTVLVEELRRRSRASCRGTPRAGRRPPARGRGSACRATPCSSRASPLHSSAMPTPPVNPTASSTINTFRWVRWFVRFELEPAERTEPPDPDAGVLHASTWSSDRSDAHPTRRGAPEPGRPARARSAERLGEPASRSRRASRRTSGSRSCAQPPRSRRASPGRSRRRCAGPRRRCPRSRGRRGSLRARGEAARSASAGSPAGAVGQRPAPSRGLTGRPAGRRPRPRPRGLGLDGPSGRSSAPATPARTASSCADSADPVQERDRAEVGPEHQGDDPGERSVGRAERGAELEEQVERDRHEGQQADRRRARRATATTTPAGDDAGAHRKIIAVDGGQEPDAERPAHDVPDRARGVAGERRGDRAADPESRRTRAPRGARG